jgi:hypothetical protein
MVVFIIESQSAQGDAPTASEFSSLTPVAMLGEYLLGSGNSGRAWFGLFAPPGTPASVVRSLESQVKKALANPGTLKPPGLGGVLASEKDAAALQRRMAASPKAPRAATPASSGGADDRPSVGGGASSN